ncbi:YheE family protein [Bacillus songklensis]|uniref:YheE family protein n=1 Tax=Bacillus songklensis TaxID=1069116 RepID=A0ABV8B0P4_9BACI
MISHFQYRPLYEHDNIPGWSLSFYYGGRVYQALYHRNGQIEWVNLSPPESTIHDVSSQIHELMLFHVYE